jgi:hypothetical protein
MDEIRERLASLRSRLSARAAGAWWISGDRLEQAAFDAAPDMPIEVADRFAAATRSVELDRVDLGIVRAAMTGRVVVSIVDLLPPDAGSGFWLRAFGAARSVAVPILGPGGDVSAVVSVALGLEPDADFVAALIRREFGPGEPNFDLVRM